MVQHVLVRDDVERAEDDDDRDVGPDVGDRGLDGLAGLWEGMSAGRRGEEGVEEKGAEKEGKRQYLRPGR